MVPALPPLWPCDAVDKPADAKLEAGQVKVYAGQGVTTTVTTLALDSGPERYAWKGCRLAVPSFPATNVARIDFAAQHNASHRSRY